jgi:hypothetical protein
VAPAVLRTCLPQRPILTRPPPAVKQNPGRFLASSLPASVQAHWPIKTAASRCKFFAPRGQRFPKTWDFPRFSLALGFFQGDGDALPVNGTGKLSAVAAVSSAPTVAASGCTRFVARLLVVTPGAGFAQRFSKAWEFLRLS